MESEAFYSLKARKWDGSEVDFESFRGCALIIANVASSCKLAESNYKSLANLLSKFYKKGLRILLFPCNQYFNQESKPIEEIHEEVSNKYSDKFEIFDKVDVFGGKTHPVFKHLINTKNGGGMLGNFIKWNFTKFLIDRRGRVVKRFGPTSVVEEDDECLLSSIEEDGKEAVPQG
ncbi:glutathione peroxidase [Encephalitozoon hellem]|uniref:Glutathione peroxidase n=1 Tax=Encephalitozoon hellem TaxID=27973 RepID=A0ABY8CL50_ENCHE|nr:glutathione peroxidase [Encephalitozoon hellem]